MKNLLLVICFVWGMVSIKAQAQNLVPNPSFEVHTNCPNNGNQIYYATPWFQPSKYNGNVINSSSSDYYNACSTLMNVPNGIGGFQYARTGNAYAGIFFYSNGGFREYIEVKLNDSMMAGNVYCVEYYVSLGFPYTVAIDNFHFYFSSDSLLDTTHIGLQPIPVIPSVTNSLGTYISDTLNWTLVSGSYTANGGEKFLTIGNFYNNSNTDTVGSGTSAYYLIDDVSVLECGTVGINRIDAMHSPKIYPNPSNGIVNVDFTNPSNYEVVVFNSIGESIVSKTIQSNSSTKIDLTEQNNGIYYINIKSNKDNFYKKITLIK